MKNPRLNIPSMLMAVMVLAAGIVWWPTTAKADVNGAYFPGINITTNGMDVKGGDITIDSTGKLKFSATGQRITGDFSNATYGNRVAFQSSTLNGNTFPLFIPNGTATATGALFINDSAVATGKYGAVYTDNNGLNLDSGHIGAGADSGYRFLIAGSTKWYIAADGGLYSISATGGSKGTDTLNVHGGLFVDGVPLIAAGASKVLDFTEGTDLASPLTLSAATWTTLKSGQSFIVANASHQIIVAVQIGAGLYDDSITIGSSLNGTLRLNIDSGTYFPLSSSRFIAPLLNNDVVALNGGTVAIGALSAGSHTVGVEAWSNVALNTGASGLYLRASTQPNFEWLKIQVMEL